jgi:hypothetical protein
MMDEYILKIQDNIGYKYYKNGQLHREDGPASFSIYNKNYNKFLNLDDQYLYKEQHSTTPSNSNPVMYSPHESYYLEDCRCDKDEFYKKVEIIKLHRQLNNELPMSQSNGIPTLKV